MLCQRWTPSLEPIASLDADGVVPAGHAAERDVESVASAEVLRAEVGVHADERDRHEVQEVRVTGAGAHVLGSFRRAARRLLLARARPACASVDPAGAPSRGRRRIVVDSVPAERGRLKQTA